MRRCSTCGRLLIRRPKLSPRLCTPRAEGARAVAAASESESRVRTKLYGWAVNGTDVRPAQSPKTAL